MHCSNITSNGHNLGQVRIFTNKKWLITYGLDGSIIVRDANVRGSKNLHFITHHRRNFGVKKAIMNYTGDSLIVLGADGSLVVVKYFGTEDMTSYDDKLKNLPEFGYMVNEDYEKRLDEYVKTIERKQVEFLTKPIDYFYDTEGSDDLTWIEWKEKQHVEEEKASSSKEKEKIVSMLTTLKNKVIDLLSNNDTCSDLKKLPISAFALDKAFREKRMKAAKDEREEVRDKVEWDCLEKERVTEFIQENFWEPQRVLAQSVFGIFDGIEITNYTTCDEKSNTTNFLNCCRFSRDLINELTKDCTIYPWKTYSETELKSEFDKQSRVLKIDDIDKLIDNEEQSDVDIEEERDQRLLLEGNINRKSTDECS